MVTNKMDSWITTTNGVNSITPEIKDTLNLRWNFTAAITDANIIAKLFQPPNCIDPTPEGMVVWRNIKIKEINTRIILIDDSTNNLTLTWKTKDPLDKKSAKVLGWSYFREGLDICSVRGSGLADTLGLFWVVMEMEKGEYNMFKLIPNYLRIKQWGIDELEKIFRNPTINGGSHDSHNIPSSIVPIPPLPTSSLPKEEDIFGPSLGAIVTLPKHKPGILSTNLPTLIGSHPIVSSISHGPFSFPTVSIRTPDVQGQTVNY